MTHTTRNNEIAYDYVIIEEPVHLSFEDWAHELRVPLGSLEDDLGQRHSIAPDMARELARIFGASPSTWL
jgi:plasmid maintenance system antidote protein VapI